MYNAENWRFEQLDIALKKKSLNDARDYLASLSWQGARAKAHADKARRAMRYLGGSGRGTTIAGIRWNPGQISTITETEACVNVLHAMADVLAQLINASVLGSVFPEKDVTAAKVKRELAPSGSALYQKFESLLSSEEFRYIEALCNKTKHRSYVKRRQHVLIIVGGSNGGGMYLNFAGFSFKGHQYPELWSKGIYDTYRQRICDSVEEVVSEIPLLL